MKKVRLAAGMAAALPAAAVTLAPGVANASAKWGPVINVPDATPSTAWVPYYLKSGGSYKLWKGDSVHVTCYYTGASTHTSDPYWDHGNKVYNYWGTISSLTGHVADYYISFGGKYPFSVGIPHC